MSRTAMATWLSLPIIVVFRLLSFHQSVIHSG